MDFSFANREVGTPEAIETASSARMFGFRFRVLISISCHLKHFVALLDASMVYASGIWSRSSARSSAAGRSGSVGHSGRLELPGLQGRGIGQLAQGRHAVGVVGLPLGQLPVGAGQGP